MLFFSRVWPGSNPGAASGATELQEANGDGDAVVYSLKSSTRSTVLEESRMTAVYTFEVFSSLDGYGSTTSNWGGYWG
jgi:hypothetical protein